ncbi:MAG: carbon-nitrogen hydrolase family protein [Verrucomicrobia bacterium]|nr:carbon-nitrogen hydrolase family protein [Verrucomicrobiota bacterium]
MNRHSSAIRVWLSLLFLPNFGQARVAAADSNSPVDSNVLRLALLRAVPKKWDLDANFAAFLQGLEISVEKKAALFLTPECWLDGYASPDKASTPEKIRGIAQDLDSSPYLKQVATKAKEHGMAICFGFTSLENGQAYNTAGLWDKTGKRLGVYHKTHLQAHDLQYASGDALPVWPTPWGPVGIMICADRRWPETARALRLQGARLILNPTYGFHNDLNEAMMRTRAYENQCFIAFAHPQQSLVTAPNGKVIAKENSVDESSGAPRVMICDIDLSQAKDDNHLRDRRPEIYRSLTEGRSPKGTTRGHETPAPAQLK